MSPSPSSRFQATRCAATGPLSATAPCGLARTLMVTALPAALAAVLVAWALSALGADIAPSTALFASARPDLLDQVLQAVVLAVPLLLLARPATRLPLPLGVWGAGYGLALWSLGAVGGVLVVDGSAARAVVALTYGAVLGTLAGRSLGHRQGRWPRRHETVDLLASPYALPLTVALSGSSGSDEEVRATTRPAGADERVLSTPSPGR